MLRILREYGANRKSNEWVSVFSLWDIVFCFPLLSILSRPVNSLLHLFAFASEKVEHGHYGVTSFLFTFTFICTHHRIPIVLLLFLPFFSFCLPFWEDGGKKGLILGGYWKREGKRKVQQP